MEAEAEVEAEAEAEAEVEAEAEAEMPPVAPHSGRTCAESTWLEVVLHEGMNRQVRTRTMYACTHVRMYACSRGCSRM